MRVHEYCSTVGYTPACAARPAMGGQHEQESDGAPQDGTGRRPLFRCRRLFAPYTGGAGVIFMLHHVDPSPPQAFEPNRILKVTPDFLEDVVREVIDTGFDIIPLDQVRERLENTDSEKPFACFTLDDGYRDNREYAYPVFRRHNAPLPSMCRATLPTDAATSGGSLSRR